MSHNRIFQLSTEWIDETEVLTESDLYESEFLMTTASYIYDNLEDKNRDILEFFMSLNEKLIETTPGSIIFKSGFRQDYFAKKFTEFKKLAQEMTLEDFAEGNVKLHRLEEAIEKKNGDIIYLGYCQPFDQFVRGLDEDKKYYIGGVLGYHC